MTCRVLIMTLMFCVCAGVLVQAEETIPDPNLQQVIRAVLEKKQIKKDAIDPADLKSIFFLDARGKGIKSLAGLQHCTNLAEVKLSDNEIGDLSPLAELKNIQSLYLSRNQVSDLKPLAQLVKLQYLELSGNEIESLEGLQGLSNMRALYLSENNISDLAPLKPLSQLRSLYLNGNQLKSLEPIAELRWVSTLGLKNNQLTDLTPLGSYTELRFTFLEGNPVTNYGVLVSMAKADVEGPKRFAPYWFLYLDEENLSAEAKAQVDQLKALGVRVNRK